MVELEALAQEPRPVGSPEHTRVRERLVERLQELGLEPGIHTSTAMTGAGESRRAVTLRNVLARVEGVDPTGTVALVAHYDGVPLSPAAGDDGVGVVTVLEVVRALLQGPPPANDVVILLTDGEELGLLGARRFAAEHPWMEDLDVVLNLEMRGGGGPSHAFETGAENGWIVEVMAEADPSPWARSLAVEVYRRMPHDTDFTVFRQAGVQGLNFAGIHRPWVYHEPTDVVENVQEATIQHKGARVLALTRALGRRDLSRVTGPDRAFTTLPGVGMVTYPAGWALPISLILLAAWVGVLALALRRVKRWVGPLAGLGVVMGTGLGAAGAGWLLARWIPRVHPEAGILTSGIYGGGWYLVGLAALAAGVATALHGLARRRLHPASLGAGALFVPVAGSVAAGWAVPPTAVELQIAAGAGVLAVGALAVGGGAGPRAEVRPGARIACMALALPVLAALVPLIQGLWIAMGFQAAPLVGVLVGVGLACVVPALDALGAPNRWWAPVGALGAGVLLVGGGMAAAGPSEERPVHSTLLYTLDREREEALWVSHRDPGFDWARERVGPFHEDRALDPFLVPATRPAAAARMVDIPQPRVELEAERADGPEGVHRVSVHSRAGAERVSVEGQDGTDLRIVGVEGRPVRQGQGVRRLTHQGVPEDGALEVDVVPPDGAEALELVVIEEHFRPWDYLGAEPFARPPYLMPSSRGRSDRALIRTPIRLPLEPPS